MGGGYDPNAGHILNVCGGTIAALAVKGYIQPVMGADEQPVPNVFTPTDLGRKVLGKLLGEAPASSTEGSDG